MARPKNIIYITTIFNMNLYTVFVIHLKLTTEKIYGVSLHYLYNYSIN